MSISRYLHRSFPNTTLFTDDVSPNTCSRMSNDILHRLCPYVFDDVEFESTNKARIICPDQLSDACAIFIFISFIQVPPSGSFFENEQRTTQTQAGPVKKKSLLDLLVIGDGVRYTIKLWRGKK